MVQCESNHEDKVINSVDQIPHQQKNSRKRQRDPSKWKRNIRKNARQQGKEYI